MAPTTKPAGSAPLRRSARIQVRMPVLISGKLEDGKAFKEEALILTVSKFGAKLKTQLVLKIGSQLNVQPKNRQQAAAFRVVWVGKENTPRAGEIGIEYLNVSNLLGVSFPD